MVGLRFCCGKIRIAVDFFELYFDVIRPLSRPEAVPQNVQFIKGSAEALPILCVSDFCERERERERERDACDVIRYHAEIASDHAYDYLDGASTQRVDAFWACRVFMHLTRNLVFERSSSRQWSSDRKCKLSVRWWACRGSPSTISLACFKQEE